MHIVASVGFQKDLMIFKISQAFTYTQIFCYTYSVYFLIYFTLNIIEQCGYHLKFVDDGREQTSGKLEIQMWML